MDRFETYLRALADFDYSFHEELQGGLQWLASKRRGQGERKPKRNTKEKKDVKCGEEESASSLEENGTVSGTDQTSSEDAGVFPAGLADFMSGGFDIGEEIDDSSEAAAKLKVCWFA